jgi:hypothetical protein
MSLRKCGKMSRFSLASVSVIFLVSNLEVESLLSEYFEQDVKFDEQSSWQIRSQREKLDELQKLRVEIFKLNLSDPEV